MGTFLIALNRPHTLQTRVAAHQSTPIPWANVQLINLSSVTPQSMETDCAGRTTGMVISDIFDISTSDVGR